MACVLQRQGGGDASHANRAALHRAQMVAELRLPQAYRDGLRSCYWPGRAQAGLSALSHCNLRQTDVGPDMQHQHCIACRAEQQAMCKPTCKHLCERALTSKSILKCADCGAWGQPWQRELFGMPCHGSRRACKADILPGWCSHGGEHGYLCHMVCRHSAALRKAG